MCVCVCVLKNNKLSMEMQMDASKCFEARESVELV